METLNGFSVLHMFLYLAVGKLVFLPPREFPVYMEKTQNRSEKYLRLPNLPLTFHFSHYTARHRNSPAVLPLSPWQYHLFKELGTIIANMVGNLTHKIITTTCEPLGK